MRHNLFSYATKELAQDAFLRWLFENHDSESFDVRRHSRNLLFHLLGINNHDAEIESLITYSQKCKVDVVVETSINGVKYVLAIEDKVDSDLHNNLNLYQERIEQEFSDVDEYHYIVYKTDLFDKAEIKILDLIDWYPCDIKDICNIFSSVQIDVYNHILLDYINYISNKNNVLNGPLPLNVQDWSLIQWKNFASNIDLNVEGLDLRCFNYRNLYFAITFHISGTNDSKMPYLEFRSRDDLESLKARILLYNIDESEYKEKHRILWKEQIRTSFEFKAQNNSQQIGISIRGNKITTINDLQKEILKFAEEFAKLFVKK